MSLPYRNYIFDLYGTLIDIHTDEEDSGLYEKMAEIYNSYGSNYTGESWKKAYRTLVDEKEATLRKMKGTPYVEIDLGEVFHELFAGPVDADIEAIALTFREISRDRLQLYPGVIETLSEIRAQGGSVYLLSNAQALFTIPELREMGILDRFDDIFISSELGYKKPSPIFMQMLLDKHQLKSEESVMIGNEVQSDVAVALSCGVEPIFLNTDGYTDEEVDGMLCKVQQDAHYEPESNVKRKILHVKNIHDIL